MPVCAVPLCRQMAARGPDHGLRRMPGERGQARVPASRGNHHLPLIGRSGIVATCPPALVGEFAGEDRRAHGAGEGSGGGRGSVTGPALSPRGGARRAGNTASAAPLPQGSAEAGMSSGLLPRPHQPGGAGRRCRAAPDHRGVLPRAGGDPGPGHREARPRHGRHRHVGPVMLPGRPAAEPGIRARGRHDGRGPDPETGALPS